MPTEEEQTFRFERTVNAPRDTVWKAWTEVDRLQHWWGPQGFTMKSVTLDLQPGGLFHYCMTSPDGHDMWGRWLIREVSPQDRLVWVNSFSDPEGNIVPVPFSPTWPAEMLCTITFEDLGDKTKMKLASIPINSNEAGIATFIEGHSSMEQGFGGTFAQLDAYLATLD